jgi:hypothetical protein
VNLCPNNALEPSWGFAPPARGLRPPRIAKAILPPGIPMMSRLRQHALVSVWCLPNHSSQSSTQRPASPSQLAFQKSQTDRAVINSRGQGRRKRLSRGDFRAAGQCFGRSDRVGEGRARQATLWASQGKVFSQSRSSPRRSRKVSRYPKTHLSRASGRFPTLSGDFVRAVYMSDRNRLDIQMIL